jgi:hypothetical protein
MYTKLAKYDERFKSFMESTYTKYGFIEFAMFELGVSRQEVDAYYKEHKEELADISSILSSTKEDDVHKCIALIYITARKDKNVFFQTLARYSQQHPQNEWLKSYYYGPYSYMRDHANFKKDKQEEKGLDYREGEAYEQVCDDIYNKYVDSYKLPIIASLLYDAAFFNEVQQWTMDILMTEDKYNELKVERRGIGIKLKIPFTKNVYLEALTRKLHMSLFDCDRYYYDKHEEEVANIISNILSSTKKEDVDKLLALMYVVTTQIGDNGRESFFKILSAYYYEPQNQWIRDCYSTYEAFEHYARVYRDKYVDLYKLPIVTALLYDDASCSAAKQWFSNLDDAGVDDINGHIIGVVDD